MNSVFNLRKMCYNAYSVVVCLHSKQTTRKFCAKRSSTRLLSYGWKKTCLCTEIYVIF